MMLLLQMFGGDINVAKRVDYLGADSTRCKDVRPLKRSHAVIASMQISVR